MYLVSKSAILSLCALMALFSFLFGYIGFLAVGTIGFLSGILAAVIFVLTVSILAEGFIASKIGQYKPLGGPIGQLYIGRIFIHDSCLPELLVTRALFSTGRLYISRQLVEVLEADELAVVISPAIKCLNQPSIIISTVCAFLLELIFGVFSAPWVNFVLENRIVKGIKKKSLTPISAIIFLAVLPYIELIHKLGICSLGSDEQSSCVRPIGFNAPIPLIAECKINQMVASLKLFHAGYVERPFDLPFSLLRRPVVFAQNT
ncbi:MAG: hypothetical protein AAB116_13780 [Candidatus Poribacteria bacterium]